MKKVYYLVSMLFMFFVFSMSVSADNIERIDMDIYVNQNGVANVVEKWVAKADSGSEWFRTFENMANQKVGNFEVYMDDKAYTFKDNWNVNESMSAKAGYFGLNKISNGFELCFGKSDLKKHTFTLKYDISNYVYDIGDEQIIDEKIWSGVTIKNFEVTIRSYYPFADTLDVWGYGYKGYAYVKDGKITMTSEQGLDDEYMVLLVKFPLNTFKTNNSHSEFTDFDSVKNMAEEGSYQHDYSDYGYDDYDDDISIFGVFKAIFYFLVFLIPSILAARAAANSGYGYKDNKKIDKNNTPMFREIPCKKDIYYANALINLNNFGYKESNILGAIILKWVKQGKIKFIKPKEGGLFNKETGSIDLTATVTFDNEMEEKLFGLMRAASGDGILEAKELEKWCRRNYSKFLDVFEKIKNHEINRLKGIGMIRKRTDKTECKKKNVMDDTLYKDSQQLFGLKLFLTEFSRMDTKEVLEVHLWDEYLMFAYLFGIADKVAKQLKNLYPEVLNDPYNDSYFDYNTILFIDNLSTRSVSAATSARSAAESYSGGGGGFSSGGGGGGSFGGGGGGSFGGR